MQWFFWILAFVLSAAAGYWVYRADKNRAVPYPWLTALLRGSVVFLTLLLLLAPVINITRNETEKPVIVFLQDESRSIANALGKDTNAYRKNAETLIDKLSKDYRVVTWGFGNKIQSDSLFRFKQQATDIAGALARVNEFYGTQNLGTIVLPSDGRFNQGVNPLYQQLSLKSPIYTVGLGDSATQKDIRITQTYANRIVSLNSEFEIRADIVASLANGYSNSVQLLEGGNVVSSTPISIPGDRFDRSVSFTVKADKPGLHHYVVNIPAIEGEKNTTNNRRNVFVEVVSEKKNVLIAAAAPHPDVNAIRQALAGMERYNVTVKTGNELPELNGYQIIILHQLPSQGNPLVRLRALNRPTWYILGAQTNPQAINEMQQAVQANINAGALRDVFPAYNTNFNIFNLPQNIQAVLDKMPPLNVPMGKLQPNPSAQILLQQRNGGEQVPLWVLQQGTTPLAVLAGEGIWRWRVFEFKNFGKHDVIDECIRQTVSFLSVNNNEKPFQVQLPKYVWSDQEAVTLNAYLLNANNEQINTPEVQLTITDSAGRKQNFSFERAGSSYKLNIGVWAGGTYNYIARTTYNGKAHSETGSFVVESMPLELMESGADYALLYGLANKYNGGFVPAANIASLYDSITKNERVKPIIRSEVDTVPLVDWKWYFFLILLFAVAEWLLRKYWMAQ